MSQIHMLQNRIHSVIKSFDGDQLFKAWFTGLWFRDIIQWFFLINCHLLPSNRKKRQKRQNCSLDAIFISVLAFYHLLRSNGMTFNASIWKTYTQIANSQITYNNEHLTTFSQRVLTAHIKHRKEIKETSTWQIKKNESLS